jgi:hypothetical protein
MVSMYVKGVQPRARLSIYLLPHRREQGLDQNRQDTMPDAYWTQGFPHIVEQTSSKYRGVRVSGFTERAGDGKAVMLIHRGHLLEQV